jgi:hypothetical protein
MRAALLTSLAGLLLVPATAVCQANWTPNSTAAAAQSALQGASVGIVTLSPEAAKGQYNILINEEQQFVAVQGIEKDSRASHSLIAVGDLIDTIIVGGERPQHGSVRSAVEFDRLVSLCVPSCLVVVRHKMSPASDVISLGPVQEKFTIIGMSGTSAGHLYRITGGTGMCGNLTHDPEEAVACGDIAWYGFCDTRSGYAYSTYRNRFLISGGDNWLSPTELQKHFGVSSCEALPPAPSDRNLPFVIDQSALRGLHVNAVNLNKKEGEARFGYAEEDGKYIVVDQVVANTPSAKAGIRLDDKISGIGLPGTPLTFVTSIEDYYRLANRCVSECIVNFVHPAKTSEASYGQTVSVGQHGAEFELVGDPFNLTWFYYSNKRGGISYGGADGPEVFTRAFELVRKAGYRPLPFLLGQPHPFAVLKGQAQITIENLSNNFLRLLLMGEANREVIVSPGKPETVTLPPGEYEIALLTWDPISVFWGRQEYRKNLQYVIRYPFTPKPGEWHGRN